LTLPPSGVLDQRAPAVPSGIALPAVEALSPGPYRLPLAALSTAAGLLVASIADARARVSDPSAPNLFWLGLIVIIVPNAVLLIRPGASRLERVGSVLLIGLGLYCVKVLQSPLMFTFFDEFLHTRTVEDIVQTGKLFTPNALLPVSPLYPGMESATSSLMLLGGMTSFQAGVVLLAIARIVFLLGLFLFFEAITGSSRLAGVAALVYMANPSFVFFSAQFGYESFALALAVLTLYAVFRRGRAVDPPFVSWVLIVTFGLAMVVTHHVTTIILTGFLFVWSGVHLLEGRRGAPGLNWSSVHVVRAIRNRSYRSPSPLKPALLIGAMAVAWLVLVASTTIGYLAPALEGAVAQVLQLALGQSGPRQLFTGVGPAAPTWEVATGYISVAIILVLLPWGFFQLVRARQLNSAQVTLAIVALGYPAMQVARLTERGAEISARMMTFIFIAVAYVLAVGLVASVPWRVPRALKLAIPVALLSVVYLGNVVVAVPIWMRLPGPYLVGADPRSVEVESITGAEWVRDNLGPDNRFLADRSNRLLLGTIGQQHLVTVGGDRINLRPAFFATTLGEDELGRLIVGRVRYVLVDRRLSSSLPLVGVYTERGEAAGRRRTTPIPPAALGKYDFIPRVSRLYDSGNLQVYDIGPLTDTEAAPP